MMSNSDEINKQQRVVEDGPEYRSVSIQPLAAPNMKRLYSPLENINKSKTAYNHSYDIIDEDRTSSSLSISRWKVKHIQDLPIDYNLVRTNVYVKDSSPQIVADRICEALKSLSVTVNLNGSEDKNCLFAETHNGTKMTISLFGQSGMIVVEVRRQVGCSIQFRDIAKKILRSSKGSGEGKGQSLTTTRKFRIPPMLTRRSRNVQHECIQDAFRIACTMLHSKKADTQILALESIGKMTTCSEGNDMAANLVFSSNDCLKRLLFLLDFYTSDRLISGTQSCHNSILRRKILEVLANSCEAISKSDLTGILSRNGHDLKTKSFLTLLLSCLREAHAIPHDAFQAARCMRYLLISKEVEILLVEMCVIDVISCTRSAGLTCHKALEEESNELMGQLQNVC